MSERDLLRKIAKECRWSAERKPVNSADKQTLHLMAGIFTAVSNALGTQPEPGAVPELPEFVTRMPDGASHRIKLKGPVSALWLDDAIADPDDLDRIAEACTKLAARERARRAGS